MVDQEPDVYRPRRALVDPDPEPQDVPQPAPAIPVDDEEPAKPLFREEADGVDAATVRTGSSAAPPVPAPPAPATSTSTSTSGTSTTDGTRRPLTFVQRRPRPDEEEATTLLPRTGGQRPAAPPEDLDLDDEPRRGLGSRTKLALLIGVVAAVVVVGLAIMYAVTGVQRQPGASPTPSTSAGSTAPTATPTAPPIGDASMLTAAAARAIDSKRTWAVKTTASGDSEDAPGPACLGTDPLEGAPSPQQKVLRTLAANGKNPPGALHLAQAYATAEEAGQAYAVTAKALGACAITGDYLESGRVVTGAGDEATAAVVKSVSGTAVTGHTVMLSRTGRVLDVLDAYQPKESLDVRGVAKALAAVLATQCTSAGGACATAVKVSDGPPPAGGDEPGFLTTGDLPPASKTLAPWVATPVEAPAADFTGSQCETVNWSTLAATSKSGRTYLLQDTPGFFGLNDIVVTTKDAATATKLVDKIRSDWGSCKERKLTATVASPTKVSGVAAQNAAVTGYATTIEQKAGDTTTRFRVGIAASGTKVAFTFLNPVNGLDLTTDQWNDVVVRAAQRATQTG